MPDTHADRVAFEAKVAFLERAVEILNQTVQVQGRSLHDLEERLAKLETKLDGEIESEGTSMRPHDDPPPHY
jgi:uncharacterized coiled-coil protein SlyX